MNIIDKSTGKCYWVTARQWVSAGNGEQSVDWANGHWADITEDILLDGSFAPGDDPDMWELVSGSMDDVRDYLDDWQHYNTDDERAEFDEDERKRLAATIPRGYVIIEIV